MNERLVRAEAFVRNVLKVMGQHDDAMNDAKVRAIALKVLAALDEARSSA